VVLRLDGRDEYPRIAVNGPTIYDADSQPHALQWRALDGKERIRAVVHFHVQRGIAVPHLKWHALMHVNIENMLLPARSPMSRALQRLQDQGVGRHDAIHTFAAVTLAHPVDDLMGDPRLSPRERQLAFNSAIDALTRAQCHSYVDKARKIFNLGLSFDRARANA
jgi:hypothetical protein